MIFPALDLLSAKIDLYLHLLYCTAMLKLAQELCLM